MLLLPNSPCSSSQSDEDCVVVQKSPTQLLSLAIQKRKQLFSKKERDYRQELLQTSFIQSLCKHLGERRARRRRRGVKRSATVDQNESCSVINSDTEVDVTHGEQLIQTPLEMQAPIKRVCLTKSTEEEDPFGLDEFFARIYGRPVVARDTTEPHQTDSNASRPTHRQLVAVRA